MRCSGPVRPAEQDASSRTKLCQFTEAEKTCTIMLDLSAIGTLISSFASDLNEIVFFLVQMHIYSCVLCFRASIPPSVRRTLLRQYEYIYIAKIHLNKWTKPHYLIVDWTMVESRMEKKHEGTAVVGLLTMLADAQLVHDLILGSVHCPQYRRQIRERRSFRFRLSTIDPLKKNTLGRRTLHL